MPRFYFDLHLKHDIILDPGGLLFVGPCRATAVADEMARHLLVCRGGPSIRGGWIRVRDERGLEVHRSSIDPDAASEGAP